ncbi:hypothetical protein F5Y18DRAFT_81745 [Xylariaceae sp. FL1019]|nr:hypothetical protein F5Y18DRAFT_81745 [Xylariaceae sp. FL1019]
MDSSRTYTDHAFEPIVITSKHAFSDTHRRLEATIPALDTTFRQHSLRGDDEGTRKALEALPPLNNFTASMRNFGGLMTAVGQRSQVVVYEIGNPLIAIKLGRHIPDILLHTPRRVLLCVEEGKVKFKFDPLLPIVARHGLPQVNEIAEALDAKLTSALELIARGDD